MIYYAVLAGKPNSVVKYFDVHFFSNCSFVLGKITMIASMIREIDSAEFIPSY